MSRNYSARRTERKRPGAKAVILAWEDDPASGAAPIARPTPKSSAGSLRVEIVQTAPPAKRHPVGAGRFAIGQQQTPCLAQSSFGIVFCRAEWVGTAAPR
jgi:hypothetical protein